MPLETHIRQGKMASKLLGCTNISENINDRRNGGFAIYIHKEISYQKHTIKTVSIENIAIKLGNTVLVCVYKLSDEHFARQDLDNIFEKLKAIETGDMNAKNVLWGGNTTNTAGRQLERYT